ncbi:FAD-binding oxidoreductase [Natronosporangium hydrolyticum]|uniref:FAD-binding oxidoreductase n=1 Tax=Natronosporangium hydrolyticum TaxID=2811111 RepID=A0A895YAS1_9ACTN|nr:FAD-binding oxidoreductase [Natronosporangium hydrolyticum]QSB14847.1 FAD-binding oxidoreductase [Natronosporangium hydrolyticum]
METRSASLVVLDQPAVSELASQLRGQLVGPTDPGYDDVRRCWNGMIDKRPALVVRCAGPSDVRVAVEFARKHGLPVAVRGGGHNVSGNAICDGGLVVDLSGMRGVRVDPANRTVRAEGGATIGDLDRETQVFGLAVPMGVVSETGIAGLTLGGGLGWLRRRYGLSCDNLLSVDLVTASGELITVEPGQHPDLWWALAGGGGNFGVVTSFEFRAHPVGPEVYFAFVLHPRERAAAALRQWREWAADAPDEISSFAVLWRVPELPELPPEQHGRPAVVLLAMHSGDPAAGEEALRPLRELGTPVADLSGPMSYLGVQSFFDEDYPPHVMRYYWKSRYLTGLPDEAIDQLVSANDASPSPRSNIDIWQLGGAMSRRSVQATAFGDRSAPFLVGVESNWELPADDEAGVAWGRETFAQLAPFSMAGGYLNFPGFYEDHDRLVADTFGPNLGRLRATKRRYDPSNLFRLNHNIRPS